MFDENDIILPEGFDPNADEQHFEEEVSAQGTETPETATQAKEPTISETEPPVTDDPASATEPPATEPEPEQTVTPQTIRVKYNGVERDLTLDEARNFAEKGMNYDKIAGRSKEQGARLARYEQMAKQFGFDNAEAMMTQAEQNYVDTKVQDLVRAGNTEAMARFLVQQEMKQANAAAGAAAMQPAPETPSSLTPERRAELEEFSTAYPGVTKIPQEVFDMHKGGVRLKMAYDIYAKQKAAQDALEKATNASKAAQSELSILKQNQAAAVKGPVTGSVGKAAPEQESSKDPFLVGFESDNY